MATQETYVQKLQRRRTAAPLKAQLSPTDFCATNQIAQPQFQDYSDPRGIRTAWSSSVFVRGREYRAQLWRDYRFLEQSREEAAEVAWKALTAPEVTQGQYNYNQTYSAPR